MKRILLVLLQLSLIINQELSSQITSGLNFFKEDVIHRINIVTSNSNFIYDIMNLKYLNEDSTIIATTYIDNVMYDSVGFKERGASTSNASKPSLKVDFNYWKPGGKFDGLKGFILRNCIYDPSYMKEFLGYKMNRIYNGTGLRTTYVRLYLNNTYMGLYLAVEHINGDFCKERFGNGKGNLFKTELGNLQWDDNFYQNGWYNSILQSYEPKTNEEKKDSGALIRMLKAMNYRGSAQANLDTLEKYWDVSKYVMGKAADDMVDLNDNSGHNFYIYHNFKGDGKWKYIGWDYDLSMFYPCAMYYPDTSGNMALLYESIFRFKKYETLYFKTVSNLMYQHFHPKKLKPLINSLHSKLRPYALTDPTPGINIFTSNTIPYDSAVKYEFNYPIIWCNTDTNNVTTCDTFNNYLLGIIPFIDSNYRCVHPFMKTLGYNYKVLSMVNPTKNQIVNYNQLPFYPKVNLSNNRFYVADSVKLAIDIYVNTKSYYKDTIWVKDLYCDSSKTYSFKKLFTAKLPLNYSVKVNFLNINDDSTYDNTLNSTFSIASHRDLAILNIENIKADSVYNLITPSIKPSVKIKLFGNTDVSNATVYVQIMKDNKTVYNSSQLFNLKFDSTYVAVPNSFFHFDSVGDYSVLAYLNYTNDLNKANDTIKLNFKIRKDLDLVLRKYTFPQSTYLWDNGIIKPNVEVKNDGITNSSSNVTCQIEFNNNVIYQTSKPISLANNQTKLLDFDSSLVLNDTGWYHYQIYHGLMNDNVKTNDTIKGSFYVQLDKELELISVALSPAPLVWNSGLKKPVLKVFNHGLSKLDKEFYLQIKKGNSVVYSSSKWANLEAEGETIISFDSTYNFLHAGDIELKAYVMNHSDINHANDTTSSLLNVSNYHDIEVKKILSPSFGQVFVNQKKTKIEVELKNNGNEAKQTNVYFTIYDSLNNVISTSNALVQLNSLETKTVVSDSMQLSKQVRVYYCSVHQNNNDENKSNDTLKAKFYNENTLQIVSNTKEIGFSVYPNPFRNELIIEMNSEFVDGKLELYDANGKLIIEEKLKSKKSVLGLETCTPSIYVLIIRIDNQVYMKKIVKQ